jgi:hypothetical protein
MTLQSQPKVCPLGTTGLALSAVRLLDHVDRGQLMPFSCPLSEKPMWEVPEAFVDLCMLVPTANGELGLNGIHSGLTLWDALQMLEEELPWRLPPHWKATLPSGDVQRFLWEVSTTLWGLGQRKAVRNKDFSFGHASVGQSAPPGHLGESAVVLPGWHSKLERWLQGRAQEVRSPRNWRSELQTSGIPEEEVRCSGFRSQLDAAIAEPKSPRLSGAQCLSWVSWRSCALSVIPVINVCGPQIKLEAPCNVANLPVTRRHKWALKPDATVQVVQHSRSLGLRVERIQAPSLWGTDVLWQSVRFHGDVLADADGRQVFEEPDTAEQVLLHTAKLELPRHAVNSQWQHIGWTAGKDYREWLVTLPWHPVSYHGPHFEHRNVLAHVRCDIREDESGQRFLLLQEVQSDWARQAQRHRKACNTLLHAVSDEPSPNVPFLKDWVRLTMKLMVWQAASLDVAGVAWTTGRQQARRHGFSHLPDLQRLYDQELSAIAGALFVDGVDRVGQVELYVPCDFSVVASPSGYVVHDDKGRLKGCFETMDAAWDALQDGAREILVPFHVLRLDRLCRESIRCDGFDAWD